MYIIAHFCVTKHPLKLRRFILNSAKQFFWSYRSQLHHG